MFSMSHQTNQLSALAIVLPWPPSIIRLVAHPGATTTNIRLWDVRWRERGTFGETKNWFSVKLRQCRDSCTTMEGSGWSLEGVRNVNGSYLGRWSTLVRYSDTNTTIAIIASSKGYRGWHNGIPRYINFVCTFFRHPSISMVLPFSWLFSFKPDVCKPSLTLICLRSSSLWPIPSPPLLPCVAPSFSLESTRHDRRVPLFYLYEWPVRFLFRGENEIPSITVWIQSIVL